MHVSTLQNVLEQLRKLTDPTSVRELSDADLLERFRLHREEAAFTLLVQRHGPMVLAVCRRILGDAHAAEDAFQAAFLVLVRSAGMIRKRQSLGSWLHGVALRIAHKARMRSVRQRTQEHAVVSPIVCEDPSETLLAKELRAVLDEEIQRLPEKYRIPLVLCYLADKTHEQAARELDWPKSTVTSRLTQARQLLQRRLQKRGFTVPAGVLATLLTEQAADAALSSLLTLSTVRLAVQALAGENLAASSVVLLADGFVQGAVSAKYTAMLTLLATMGFAAALGSWLAVSPVPSEQPEGPAQRISDRGEKQAQTLRPRVDLFGDPLPPGAIARLGTRRLRHEDMVNSVVFSGDGKTAIAGDNAGFIIYWDVATGHEIRRLQKMPESVHTLAITRDGKTLASVAGANLFLWEVGSGKLLSHARLDDGDVDRMVFMPGGRMLVMYEWTKNVIHLWDTVNNKKLYDLTGLKGDVSCIALSPDSKTLATGSLDAPTIHLWDIASGKEKNHFKAHEHQVWDLSYSPDGKTLASIGNGELALFDPNTGELLLKVRNPNGGDDRIAYAPDGKTLIGIRRRSIHILDAANGKEIRSFDALRRAMNCLASTPDGKTLATFGGGPTTFDLWDVASGKLLHPAPGHRQYIDSLFFSADGRQVFSSAGISDFPVQAWDARTGARLYELGDQSASKLALSPDGKFLAASCYHEGQNGHAIGLWDLASRKEALRCIGHKYDTHKGFNGDMPIDWSADGKTLVSSSLNDKTIRMWDAATGKQLRVIDAKQEWPSSVILSPDGKMVAAGGYQNGAIRLWSARTSNELRKIATPQQTVQTLAFSPDSSVLASGGYWNAILLWEPQTGRLLRQLDTKTNGTSGLAFARDGRTLVSGHNDGSIHLWEIATGKELACFQGHPGGVRAVAISRDGRLIASGGNDGIILIWDATGGARPDVALSAEQLRILWEDLNASDAGRAYRALWQLASSPKEALPFLAESLRPVAPLDEARRKRVDRLLAELDSDRFAVRQEAAAELEKMGPRIEPALRKALESRPSLETRRRMEAVLAKFTNERPRLLRALEALEHMNTPEAQRLVSALANGAPSSWLTEEARAVGKRLAKKALKVDTDR